jgi:hypothetical protein
VRRRVGVACGLAAGVLAASAAHVFYWYLPRERGGQPSPEARTLLLDPAWSDAAWIAYPHQNLGRLERQVGDLRAWLALLRGAAGAAAEQVPSFGPFVVPPASELVVARDARGGELRAMARVYPAVGLLARAAGRIARNPWLGGGEVGLGRRGRARVSWRDGCWLLESDRESVTRAGSEIETAGIETADGEPRALIRLGEAVEPLPAALYRLVRADRGLELRLGPASTSEPMRLDRAESAPAAWMVESNERVPLRALVLWDEEGAIPGFPAAATLARGVRPRSPPGADLLRMAGRRLERRQAAGLEIRATTAGEADRAAILAPALAAAVDARPGLRWAAGADVARLGRLSERLARRFAALPIARLAGFDPARIAAALVAAEDCGVSRLELRGAPERLRWQLCPGSEPAPSR